MKINKKITIEILLVATLLGLIFLINPVSAASNYCCEKTLNGAWCQNAPQEQCDSGFKIAPTSCDSTSYCKKGCCFDSNEGLCMEGTPQKVCEDSNGTWADNAKCDVPQCNLGCCILADQGAFVTLTRCKQMSGFYGIKTDFRTTITDELTCISTAQAADKGACVIEDPALLKKKCIFTTRANCKTASLTSDSTINVTGTTSSGAAPGFYKDYLCTAEELGTECAPDLKNTVTISGKDEVYFQDTCGNVANIYDADKAKDKLYWKKVFKKSDSCGAGSSNAGSTTCGNCDYYLGSIAKKATGILGIGTPAYGSYICADLSCKKEGKSHGESWCVHDTPSGDGKDTVGSRYYREICLNGEVITEPCADYRNEICIEDTFNGFSEAQCRVNRWQDCTQQKQESDCSNTLVRDCKWITGYYFSDSTGQIERSATISEQTQAAIDKLGYNPTKNPTPSGLCVPNYPAGSNFWGDSQTTSNTPSTPVFNATTPGFGTGYVNPSTNTMPASTMCSLGNVNVVIEFNRTTKPADFLNLFGNTGDWTCGNDACIKYVGNDKAKLGMVTKSQVVAVADDMNNICSTLGDCGGKTNWVGQYTDDGYAAYLNKQRLAGSGGAEVLDSKTTTTTTPTTTTPTTTTTPKTTTSVNDIATVAQTGGNLVNTVSGKAIDETATEKSGGFIQFRVIINYFKNKLGLGGN